MEKENQTNLLYYHLEENGPVRRLKIGHKIVSPRPFLFTEGFYWNLLTGLADLGQYLYLDLWAVAWKDRRRLAGLLRERNYPVLVPPDEEGFAGFWRRVFPPNPPPSARCWMEIEAQDLTTLLELQYFYKEHPFIHQQVYAAQTRFTPFYSIFKQAEETLAASGFTPGYYASLGAALLERVSSGSYPALLEQCAWAFYGLDLPYRYIVDTTQLSRGQLSAILQQAAGKAGLPLAEGKPDER